jgi:capsular polysaccharide biosynthesis protein
VLPADATVLVRRLVYIPGLTDGFLMHREVLSVLDRIRAAAFDALGGAAALPWRRIYVSRADAWLRRLTNEAEITELAERAGFTPVTLTGMPVAEQVRLFAEASHIVAPHGAGLANIGFCRPGAALCELQMDAYVQWSFRHLAARRRVRYGCVIGRVEAPRAQWVHNDSWRIDPAAVVAALRDGRFGR